MERMVLLLAAARDQGVVPCRRSRRVHLYGRGQVFGRVMRHLRGLAPIQVRLLARRMVSSAGFGPLVAAPGGALRIAAREIGAQVAAVGMAVIAPPAQVEDLTTATTADEAQRIHVPAPRQKLDARSETCDEQPVDPRPVDDLRARSGYSGPSFLSAASDLGTAARTPARVFSSGSLPLRISAVSRAH
jgi:hypothetical protein